jgi:hypothetical protein
MPVREMQEIIDRSDVGVADVEAATGEVGAVAGAGLLGISLARFARLARGGCFSPVGFRIGRHRVIDWRYRAAEVAAFAERRPELLSGPMPEGLRRALRRGEDWRPRRWRSRRTDLLSRQAGDAWERAAVLVAVLDPPTVAAEVRDARERALLYRLRPHLVDPGLAACRWDAVGALLTATDPDEARWYRASLALALRDARREGPVPARAGPWPVRAGRRRSP